MSPLVRRCTRATAALVALLALGTTAAQAQVISGAVHGAGAGLVSAQVRILELDRIAVTGAGGRYAFRDVPHGTYHLFAGLIGYASATLVVPLQGDSASVDFDLAPSAIPMPQVVVSATPFPRTSDDQYQSVESKPLVEFENSAGSSFAEKLSDLPGVNVRGNGSAPSRPVIRGLSDNRVLILENGLRTGDIATYDPAHATPLEAVGIDQIDVVRGPSSILYGPTMIGGLVNVITNIVPTVADHPLSGSVVMQGNSVSDEATGYFNTVLSGAHQALRISAGGLHSSDIRIPSGNYTDPASGAVFPLDRIPQTFDQSWEEGAGYVVQGDFGRIGVGAKRYVMNYGIPGVPPNADWMDVPPSTSRIEQKRNTFELRGLFNTGNGPFEHLKLEANYNDYNHSEFPTAEDSTGVSDPQANHFHKRAMNATLQFEQRPVGRLEGTLGLWTNVEDLTIGGDQPLGPNSRTTGVAGYAYEELVLSPRTRLQGGLRYDYNGIRTRPNPVSTDSVFLVNDQTRTANAVTASFGAIQKLTSELTGSFSLSRSFRAPTVQELFANGLDAASGTYSIGSASLGPETGFGIDAGLHGHYPRVAFDLTPYANFISDYIYGFLRGDTIQAFPVRQFAATDASLMGFEASVTTQPFEHVALRGSADYVSARDTKHDVPLPFTPPLRGLVRATYQDRMFMAMGEVRMAAKQTQLGDGDTPTNGYAVLNLGAGLRLWREGMAHDIGIHCDNVLNTVYRDHLSVIKDFVPQPGRGFRVDYTLQY